MSMGTSAPEAPAPPPAPRRDSPLVPRVATKGNTDKKKKANLQIKRQDAAGGAPKVGLNIPRI